MPKVKKPKTKQKQKQKQSQRVVVNINTGRATARRRAPARRSGGGGGSVGGGGGVGAFSSPIYLNAPSDLSPIIQNLPAQYQHLPAITMPTNTAPQPSLQALTYPTPTTLQTATADVRPLGGSARGGGSVDTSMTPVSIDTGPPKPRFKPPTTTLDKDNKIVQLIEKPASFGGDLFTAISLRKKKIDSGESIIPMVGSNIPRVLSPFQEALRESASQRQSRAPTPTIRPSSPTLMTLYPSLTSGFESPARMPSGFGLSSPSGLGGFGSSRASRASSLGSVNEPIGNVPRNRRQDLSSLTEEEKHERRNKQKKQSAQKIKQQNKKGPG